MARKSTPTALPIQEPVTEPASSMCFELMPIAVLQRAPRTREEVAVRDEIRQQLAAVESTVVDFVAAKSAEGFNLDEAFALFSLELPLFFSYQKDGSKIRARYGCRIIERSE